MKKLADEIWPGGHVIPEMETGASDSIYTMAAGIPSYRVSGVAIDGKDVRAHGKDERLKVSSFYDGVDFITATWWRLPQRDKVFYAICARASRW